MEAIALVDPFLRHLAQALAGRSAAKRTLIAVSGGRDSVALLHGLHRLGWKNLVVVHLDHKLRGRASTADARFVRRLVKKLNLPGVFATGDVRSYAKDRKISIEHAARELRHVFFAGAARRERSRTVFLAHHADDQIETCLFNFLRGSGAAGLAGMRKETTLTVGRMNLTLVRPLLAVRRSEIDAFLLTHRLAFREDATNAEPAATRNRLRHRVLPAVRDAVGVSSEDAILRAAEILADEESWMQSETDRIPRGDTLNVRALSHLPLALQRRVIRRWLADGNVPAVGLAEVERVRALLSVDAGPAKINLPGGCHARRRGGEIFFELP